MVVAAVLRMNNAYNDVLAFCIDILLLRIAR